MDQARSITVDGISYDTAQFSPEVQQAVGIYNAIALDLQKSQLEAIKCQAALQTVGNQISADFFDWLMVVVGIQQHVIFFATPPDDARHFGGIIRGTMQ